MIEATIRTERQLQVLRGRAASIRRGDQVALLAPDDADGQGIAGAVTGVRAGFDQTVALVVANRVPSSFHSTMIVPRANSVPSPA